LQRADFFAYQGQLMLLEGRFVDALAALERSILLDNARLGVQLDYVLALSKTGDIDSARALALQVLERDDAPVAVRLALESVLRDEQQAQQRLAAGSIDRWQWRGSVQSLLGRDSNLNSATSADTINLTLPNGIVSLPIDASSKPKSGLASTTSGRLVGQASLDGGLLVVHGEWRERVAPGNNEFGYRQQDASMLYRPNDQDAWASRVTLNTFNMGRAPIYQGLAAAAWKEFSARGLHESMAGCNFRAGSEIERRTYMQDETQNGVYASLLGLVLCSQGDSSYQFGLQGGKDLASVQSRAGGDQARLDIRAAWDRQWEWARTSVEWVGSALQDSRAYSELLGGQTRATTRQNLRVSVTKRLNSEGYLNSWGGLYSVTVLEVLRHKSNIGLFDVSARSLSTGLRYEF
jgi:hypothetical protein